jgi:hypothetical protein
MCLFAGILQTLEIFGIASRLPYKEGVAGSNPALPTGENRLNKRETRNREDPQITPGVFIHHLYITESYPSASPMASAASPPMPCSMWL